MPAQSYSIYRGVEDEDDAELRVEESPEVTKKSPRRRLWHLSPWQKILIIATATGSIAFLLGFLLTRRPCAPCDTNGDPDSDYSYQPQEGERPKMDWTEMKKLFSSSLNDGQNIESTVRLISSSAHPAGSGRDRDLADVILQRFRGFHLHHTWMENHYAELQFPNRSSPNSLMIVNANDSTQEPIPIEDAELYCPYSAVGTVTGGLVYANYGRKEDFRDLEGESVPGNLVIVRTGHITFAEKVYNAELAGAVGVLIFPDTSEVPLYGHVHFGTGDPNTPGFPSFNHTQFPPFKSSGLPKILAQPIGKAAAWTLLSKLSGRESSSIWRSPSFPSHHMGPGLQRQGAQVQLRVTNVARSTELVNIFGSITGGFEPEHYIVVGAQRDSWGPGAAKSGVGTAILLELARSMGVMVHNGFQPRRSILFVSWDGGDFGSIGATEWLEGYLSMLHLKAATYMNLDSPVLGDEKFVARSSPLFKNLLENIIKQVENPRRAQQTIYDHEKSENSKRQEVLTPLTMDTASFSFTAFAGVPALEFSFLERSGRYRYLDTKLDTYDNLNTVVNGRLPAVALAVAQVAGLSLIRLSHDKILPMDYTAYNSILMDHLVTLLRFTKKLKVQNLTLSWLYSARGDYMRATERLKKQISESDLRNEKVVQFFNVRIMRVEFYFLSQYVSAINNPYRHILIGRGNHTLDALIENLGRDQDQMDAGELHKQIALFTWTLVGAANALSGEVWEVHRNF